MAKKKKALYVALWPMHALLFWASLLPERRLDMASPIPENFPASLLDTDLYKV